MFSSEEIARYSPQIILSNFGANGQLALKNAKVLLIGCGGLGSACSLYLVSAGIGSMTLFDYDKVELGNLHRQILYYTADLKMPKGEIAKNKLQKHNPLTKININNQKFEFLKNTQTKEFSDYDIILDCSDNQKTKRAVNSWSLYHNTKAIFAGAVGWNGFVFSLFPHQTACYRCLYGDTNIETPCSEVGVLGAVVGIIGCWQALEAIKILLGKGSFGKMFFFDGYYSRNYSINLKRKKNCQFCS